MDDCPRYDNQEGNDFGAGKKVRKFSEGMGWYSDTVESSRYQFDGSKTYTVQFDESEYEEWYDEEIA